MRRFIVWNEDKARASTYTELLVQEREQNGSISSIIETDDIEAVLVAIYNETDIDLSCREIVRVTV